MTNREKFRDELDNMLSVFLAVVNGKPVPCEDTDCRECDFRRKCHVRENCVIDWLNAEYQEPSVDWSKVPIDTPVLVSGNGKTWYRRYFAGIRNGYREAYDVGATPWSAYDNRTCAWPFMKIAEGNE